MVRVTDLLNGLPERHSAALRWFITHGGTTQPWPKPLPDGTRVASKAQGIYKPSWSKYALSVRHSLRGPYHDREPVIRTDGTWSYLYAEEATNPNSRDSDYANRSLEACMSDKVPVGVLTQVDSKPKSQYRVLGLALISGREEGFFFLEGFSPDGRAYDSGPMAQIDVLDIGQQRALKLAGEFNPSSILDARERAIASIVRRRGQPEFRRRLLATYNGRCALTGCNVEEALEAVHIVPYRGADTNHVSNGLLLRADIHTLFDLGLISIDSETMTVLVSSTLEGSSYSELAGATLQLPRDRACWPSKQALDHHRHWSGIVTKV